jgi:hypothetical protein
LMVVIHIRLEFRFLQKIRDRISPDYPG